MKKITLLVFTIILCLQTYAQVSVLGTPPSFIQKMTKNITTYYLPSVDVQKMLQEDEDEQELDKSQPLRFGKGFDVHLDFKKIGTWTTLLNGDRVWRLKVSSKGAKSVNFIFSEFYMPQGAEFYLYNEDKTYKIGAFTSQNNKSHGEFSTAPVKGKTVILEYFEPKSVQNQGIIVISSIIHAYRDMFAQAQNVATKGYGDSGSCNIDVACPASAGWENEIQSVAMIITSGNTRWCSGAMVNNTLEDQTPYFLTGEHCLDGNENSWIFVFNYESPTCGGVDGNLTQSISGSTTKASYATSDMALLELSLTPPASYQAFYAGWNNANIAPTEATCIHHPKGDVKKISFDTGPLTLGNYSTSSHWRVGNWEQGTTESGSSGSPLFDSNHRIVGQLHGGQASCGNTGWDEYGKFASSWLGGGTASTSLQPWLDPSNSVATLDGNAFRCGAENIAITAIIDTSVIVNWDAFIDTITDFTLRYREVGASSWTNISISDTNLVYGLGGLIACTDYEIQIDMNCDTAWSGFTSSFVFKTDGCCDSPGNIMVTNIANSTATIEGTSIFAALSYDMRYRKLGTANWTIINNLTNVYYNLTGLSVCTGYEVEWRTVCAAMTTSWNSVSFSTNCVTCNSLSYCTAGGTDVSDEWIEEVIFGDINNNSGVATSGYTDFTNISTLLLGGQTYPISLSQGYSGAIYPEYFSVWIDYDQSGTFDASELAYSVNGTTTFPNTGNITIPFTALNGTTRMRISMQYDAVPPSCGSYQYGEIEDYCVNIFSSNNIPCLPPNSIQSTNTTSSTTDLTWDIASVAIGYNIRYRQIGTGNWLISNVTNNATTLTTLADCTNYEFEIETDCGMNRTSGFSTTSTFSTVCLCDDIIDLTTSFITSNDVTLNWSATNNNTSYTLGYKLNTATNWNTLATGNTSYQLTNLTPGELYDTRVQITCTDGTQSGFSNVKTFRTDWAVSTSNLPTDVEHLAIYPNPFTENVNLQINIANTQEVNVEVYDITGKVLQSEIIQLNTGKNTVNLTMNNLVDGVYIIRLTTENGVATRRVVKQ
jgi:hypothetical protein